jgi:dihydroneopterin aldolase
MNQQMPEEARSFASATRRLRHVFIKQLTLMAQIGIHPHERQAAQPICISINAAVPEALGSTPETLAEVVCYEAISNRIKNIIAQGHVDLVETLAEQIADDLLAAFPIQRLNVRIEKPEAISEAAAVGVEIERLQILS